GATLDFPPRDWRGFESLAFDAYLEGTTPLPVTVRINDLEHNEQYSDRYNRTFTLKPGANRVVIDLHEVERSPAGRRMDMGRIALVCLFSYQLKEPRTVYLDNVRLGNVKAPGRLP
ncbi:MAG TPA: succinyl-CoA synthetase subunit beta, partial [Deltaproteobacteria bacterium]|nr:succinyl-CoA synthetase subunit beta [Deltaproteobacteria bacterium]